jgi:F-type H+-transporting ATPase subunit b
MPKTLPIQIAANNTKNTHASTQASSESHSDGNPLLQFDPGVGIWSIVTFVILLIILRKFAWRPIIDSIDERDREIKSSMEAAEQARNESKKIADEQKAMLSESKAEAAEIVAEAKKIADDFKRRLEQSAIEEKNSILKSAEIEIASMKESAIAELKTTVATLAIGAAEKLLSEKLDNDASIKLIDQYIEKIEA